jgi:hypothetical protein
VLAADIAAGEEDSMQPEKPTTRHRVFKAVIIVLGVPFLLAVILVIYFWWFSPLNREWVVETLEKRYQCEVELKSFSTSFFPAGSIAGEGLVLKRKERSDLPPLASVRKFSVSVDWLGLLRQPRHFGQVRLEGLVIVIPPRQRQAQAKKKQQASPFVLDEVFADGATLSILPANPNKPPHVFEIHKLRLQSAAIGQPMYFQAVLTNPIPVGQIQSSGRFGPWDTDDPSLTPLSGNYTFSHADLSTIRGLGGTLSSHGSYEGVLSQIRVQGETDTPDFDLGISGNKLHLKTQFSALVDGVNGDTLLRPVSAQLLGSTIVARGGVTGVAGRKGRIILLDVSANPARVEDFLRLAVKSTTPSIIGAASVQTKFDLHPGEEEIAKRLKLDGSFTVQSAQFTNPDVEAKISSLSRLGRGRPRDDDIQNARFDMQGHFVLANSQVTFSSFSFSLPGATVQLQGTFGLLSQALDFHGTLRLQAKVSQVTTGIKSLLLKAIDPLFEGKGAGTVLPIKITGTRGEPSFRIEIGKVFKRKE